MSSSEPFFCDIRDSIATITLNRPRFLNALNSELREGLTAQFKKLTIDDAVRVVVMRGEGRAFCAGQDQNESITMKADTSKLRIAEYCRLYETVRATGKPVIAQVHGYAMGAGLQLALLADLNIVASTAKLGMPEMERAAPCITGSTLMWPLIGPSEAKRLILTAEHISAEEALRIHLIQKVVDDDKLGAEVNALAKKVAAWPLEAVRQTMMWWNTLSSPLLKQGMEFAQRAHAANFEAGEYTQHAKEFIASRSARKRANSDQ